MSGHDQREDYQDFAESDSLAPAECVRWPASAMWILGFLQLIGTQVWISLPLGLLILGLLADGSLAHAWQVILRVPFLWISFLSWPFATLISIVVMSGASCLAEFRRHTWVLIASSLTLLSMPILCLGAIQVPLGVWLICLILRPEVRARFEAVARCDKTSQSCEHREAE
jgi:hypothetical protein